MIILFDENEKKFDTLGIGVLTDASSCVVAEELNGAFELEMEYPVTGAHYKDLKLKRLILVPPNDTDEPQPFRIYKITKPIDGIVTVYAEHISYDISKVPIRRLKAQSLKELIAQINSSEKRIIESPFILTTDKVDPANPDSDIRISYETKVPYSFRSLLAGNEKSIKETYSGDLFFDRFKIELKERRGQDRDFTIRYSKNMTDLEQESSGELLYTGICPYYNNTNSETKTGMTVKYNEAYLSSEAAQITTKYYDPDTNEEIHPANWIAYKVDLKAITSILSYTVTNIIATEGDYYNHLIHAKMCKALILEPGSETPVQSEESKGYIYDVTYKMAYINTDDENEGDKYWLCKDPELTERWVPETMDPKDAIFRIYSPGDKLYKVYIWKDNKYQEPTKDDNIETYAPVLPSTYTETVEKDNIILYEGDIIYINEIRAIEKDGSVPFSANWLQEAEEVEQLSKDDPRFIPKADIDPTKNPVGTIYKVPRKETAIHAYMIPGKKYLDKDFLTLTEGSDEPLTPEDAKLYEAASIDPKTLGKIFYFRYSEYDGKYDYATDSRFTYENYEWNGTEYIVHPTTDDKILTLDLTDKFKDTPKNNTKFQKMLYEETIKYAKENNLGKIKDNIKVSFIKLSSTTEYSKWKELEKVTLGDSVHVIYEDLGINEAKRVSKTEYNVLTESYDSIELGDKQTTFSNNAVIEGDNLSALTNDRHFGDITTMTKLIAERIEAEYIKAVTAEITEAQIDQITSNSITTKFLHAAELEIDTLVSTLLVADDAQIKNTLTAGDIVVNGLINITNGSIEINSVDAKNNAIVGYEKPDITEDEKYKMYWLVTSEGGNEWLQPTIGELYKVYNKYGVFIGYYKYSADLYEEVTPPNQEVAFKVDEFGNLTANNVDLTGKITATSGQIGQLEIINNKISIDFNDLDSETIPEYLSEDNIENIEKDLNNTSSALKTLEDDNTFLPKDLITGLSITSAGIKIETQQDTLLEILPSGSITVKGTIYADAGQIGDCVIEEDPVTHESKLIVPGANITELSADKIVGGSIRASNIKLGKRLIRVQADIAEPPYTEEWLIYDGGELVIPEVGKYYEVTNIPYKGKIYTWNNEQNKYEEVSPYSDDIPTNLDIDEDGNVEINKGTISIKFAPIECYINSSAETYSYNWLTTVDTKGQTIIVIPDEDDYYLIIQNNTDYTNKYFQWSNQQNKYIEVATENVPIDNVFEVDRHGNVTAHTVRIANGSIETTSGILNGIDSIVVNNTLSVGSSISTSNIDCEELTIDGINIARENELSQTYITATFEPSCSIVQTAYISSLNKYETTIEVSFSNTSYTPLIKDKDQNTIPFSELTLTKGINIWIKFMTYSLYNINDSMMAFGFKGDITLRVTTNSHGKVAYRFTTYTDTEPSRVMLDSIDDGSSEPFKYYNVSVEAYTDTIKTLSIDADNLIGIKNIQSDLVYADKLSNYKWEYMSYSQNRVGYLKVPVILAGKFTFSKKIYHDVPKPEHADWYFKSWYDIIDSFGTKLSSSIHIDDVESISITVYNPGNTGAFKNYGVWWGSESYSPGTTSPGVYINTEDNNTEFCLIITLNV